MGNTATIETFIKKYRLALSNKSKDIRITIEEAGELVAWIAMINSNQETIQNIDAKITDILKMLQSAPIQQTSDDAMDGGLF